MTENKIAVLGSEDFTMPFAALGLDTYPVSDDKTAIIDNAKKIVEDQYSLALVAENVAQAAEEIFNSVRQQTLPCVLVVPFTTEPEGFATRSLGQALKMAMGVDILKDD